MTINRKIYELYDVPKNSDTISKLNDLSSKRGLKQKRKLERKKSHGNVAEFFRHEFSAIFQMNFHHALQYTVRHMISHFNYAFSLNLHTATRTY